MKKLLLLCLLGAGCVSAFSLNDILFWKLVRSTDAGYTALTSTTNSITAIQTDLTTLGDVTNSYVVWNSDVLTYEGQISERPNYGPGLINIRYPSSEGWILEGGNPSTLTNPATSYYPPLTGWYDASTGLATNLNIKFFSGTDALQQAQIDDMKSAYGSVYIHDGTNTVALTTTNYTLVSMWQTDNPQSKAAPTNCVALTNGVRGLMDGVYNVSYSLSMLGQNNSVIETGIFVDGVHQNMGEFNRKISTGADVGTGSAVGQLVLTSNQIVNVGRITDTAGTYTIVQGSLCLTRISPVSTVDGVNYALKDGSNITDPAAFRTAIGAAGTNVSRTVYLPFPFSNAGTPAVGVAPNCVNPSIFVPKFSQVPSVAFHYQVPLCSTNVMLKLLAANTSETNTGYEVLARLYSYKDGGGFSNFSSFNYTNATSTNILTYNFSIPANIWTNQNNVQIRIGISSNAAFSSIPTGGVFVVESVATIENCK